LKKKNSCDTRAVSGYFSEEGADERMKLVRWCKYGTEFTFIHFMIHNTFCCTIVKLYNHQLILLDVHCRRS
jgi:hypothetical protein